MQFVDIQGKLREIDITQKGLKRASFKEKFLMVPLLKWHR
jgi:hypothetical protein